ncbi:MAG: electron transport complex subunit RsxA [Clostridiaceae bacterium]|jgi:electron transport complex protein RnfA|nr:electron transport complex subunit RsxA [Bacillota bacterium]NLI38031.1 electron transport complex subunit RsxA [Clostridiaceae bacterium]
MKELFVILIGAMFIENFVLSKFLGICPFLGVSQKTSTALGMSGAVVFVMTLSSAATYLVNDLLLKPNDLEYLQTIAFILVIAALVQFVEIVLKKLVPPLYKALGIYLPLITTNCAVLGSALINVDPERNYSLLEAIFFGFSAGLGFTIALILFSGIRERLETSDIPESFKGMPIALIAASLVSVAFVGFAGLVIQ